jgi:hypothetical protein
MFHGIKKLLMGIMKLAALCGDGAGSNKITQRTRPLYGMTGRNEVRMSKTGTEGMNKRRNKQQKKE